MNLFWAWGQSTVKSAALACFAYVAQLLSSMIAGDGHWLRIGWGAGTKMGSPVSKPFGRPGPDRSPKSIQLVGAFALVMEKSLMYQSAFRAGLGLSVVLLLWWGGLVGRSFAQQDQNAGMAGVVVSPDGVLRTQVVSDPTGQIMRDRIAAARSTLPADIARFSKLRKVSLPRLERAIIRQQGVVTEDMKYLAGLLRIRYVFLYPESGDILLAGPAEGWVEDPTGHVVGLTTGRPVIQLQDLVTALRAYPPDGEGPAVIGCSIDPTQEGLARMQEFLRSMGSFFPPGREQEVAAKMVAGVKQSLGMHQITITGVPPDTHFAHVLVEADYRMKLIGIGLERPPVRMVSFVDRALSSSVSPNQLFRWYFVPDYQCLRVSDDGSALELVGEGVKLVGEDELVTASGERKTASAASLASKAFTTSFTKNYPQLAARVPVYAELRNLIDMAVVAAYMQKQDYYGRAQWKMEFFRDEKKFPVRVYPAPKMAESAVTAVIRPGRVSTPVGGGVQIEPEEALQSENLLPDEKGEVQKTKQSIRIDVPEDAWWWD